VAQSIAVNITQDVIVVTKSTVPVGTNEWIKKIIYDHKNENIFVDVVSNPEFLREGSAVYDTFNGDRIVIGADNEKAALVIEEINKPFGIPIFKTDIRSAEMIKYASNAFFATKISFINEIANICEKLGANVEDVAYGMGLDTRIGLQFLEAGIGYGGSCFPKDTHALVQIAGNIEHKFDLLEAVINVNNKQQAKLVDKARERFNSLKDKKIAILGLAFKPNTDDMREAASIIIVDQLVKEGASVIAYDPIAMDNAKRIIGNKIDYADSVETAPQDTDIAFIVTEWEEFKKLPLSTFEKLMKTPIVFDGRNCYALEEVEKFDLEYYSVGRPSVIKNKVNI
jgi:UDPglucose 6-dehydrogenase